MDTLYGWSQNAVSLMTKIQTEMVEKENKNLCVCLWGCCEDGSVIGVDLVVPVAAHQSYQVKATVFSVTIS